VAQKNVTIIIDDLTGKELADGAGETVSFSLDGVRYELDVDSRSAGRLRSLLAPYIKAGRRLHGTHAARTRRVRTGNDPAAVRAWAASNGFEVNARGRVPAHVVAQFEAAGN
jgi:nucleoid-associated protein Lsr2